MPARRRGRSRSGRRLDTFCFETGVDVPGVARRGAALKTPDGREGEMIGSVESVARVARELSRHFDTWKAVSQLCTEGATSMTEESDP